MALDAQIGCRCVPDTCTAHLCSPDPAHSFQYSTSLKTLGLEKLHRAPHSVLETPLQ